MSLMNTEQHSTTQELPYRIVFGWVHPNQTNPLSDRQIVDERDLDGTEQITRPPIPASQKPEPAPGKFVTVSDETTVLEVEQGRPTCLNDAEECDMVGHINDDSSVTPEPQDDKLPATYDIKEDKLAPSSVDIEDERIHAAEHPPKPLITEIQERAFSHTKHSASKMSLQYAKKKRMKVEQFQVGENVSVNVPKNERVATDLPRIPGVITKVYEKSGGHQIWHTQIQNKSRGFAEVHR